MGEKRGFHSAIDTEKPAITIRLDASREIGHIWIQNRTDTGLQGRADGLTVWVSEGDGKYREVWKSQKPQPEWSIDLPEGTNARFIKIGLAGKGTLHLSRVAVYGK